MDILAIDIGNSRCKSCFGRSDQGFPEKTFDSFQLADIESHFQNFATFDLCVISSVNTEASSRVRKMMVEKVANKNLMFLNSKNSPIDLKIDTPETLGADRIAAAVGAYKRNGSQSVVIDSGTAVTIDAIDEDGAFLGGTISPGIGLSFRALAQGTNKLPSIAMEGSHTPEFLGKDTSSAIRSGVFWSQIGAAERIVRNLKNQYGEMPVTITGGHGEILAKHADFRSQYCKSLVLEGLWEIGVHCLHT